MSAELSPQEEDTLLRIADGDGDDHDVEEAVVSRLQSLALVEQRGLAMGLTGYFSTQTGTANNTPSL